METPERPFTEISEEHISRSSSSSLPAPASFSISGRKASISRLPTARHDNIALFRTRSRLNPRLDEQISRLREERQLQQQFDDDHQGEDSEEQVKAATATDRDLDGHPVPLRRYFDALRGPELEELHDSEHALLPRDGNWPFLLRFPISSFGIVLGLGSQSILWKQLHAVHIRVPPHINQALWGMATLAYTTIAVTYICKIIFYFEAVRREYYHPVRVNFFFAPWIGAMFLALGLPKSIHVLQPHTWTWCVLMTPLVILELKIYGQWVAGGERKLSKVANPSTHLSVVGNFVGALLGASVGWKEPALFFWSIGLAHYIVLFVTLYQRLPTNETLPKELHPVFFLFIAAPSAASVAWEYITGEFGLVSRVIFFIALFLFGSLAVRINFFRGFKFSLAWWAYTFPMTALSIASIRYAKAVNHPFTRVVAYIITSMSALMVLLLFISTLCHLLYWKTLFPNDMAIAITHVKHTRKAHNGGFGYQLRNLFTGSNSNLVEDNTRGVCNAV